MLAFELLIVLVETEFRTKGWQYAARVSDDADFPSPAYVSLRKYQVLPRIWACPPAADRHRRCISDEATTILGKNFIGSVFPL